MARAHAMSNLLAATWLATTSACAFDPENLPEMTFEVSEKEAWKAQRRIVPPGAGEGRIFVTNNLDDTVSVLDLDHALRGEPSVLGAVPVGFVPVEREGPHHVTVDEAGEFYYVGISNFVPGGGSGPHGVHGNGSAEGHLLKLRVDDNAVVASVRVDRNPGDVRLAPDGRWLLATHFDLLRIAEAGAEGITSGPELDARLAIVDPTTMTRVALVPACPAAHGIGITDDSSRAVMSCLSDEVAVVDLGTREVRRVDVIDGPGTAAQPVCGPYAVTMDGATAWASCYETGQVVAISTETAARDGRSFQLPGLALFGEVREGVMVIAHQGADGISFIDTTDATTISTRLMSPDECVLPHVARWSEPGAEVLVVCEGNKSSPGTLLVLDAEAPHAVRGRAELGIFPDDLAMFRRAP